MSWWSCNDRCLCSRQYRRLCTFLRFSILIKWDTETSADHPRNPEDCWDTDGTVVDGTDHPLRCGRAQDRKIPQVQHIHITVVPVSIQRQTRTTQSSHQTSGVCQTQYFDRGVDVLVSMQHHAPTILTSQKTVDVPQTQYLDLCSLVVKPMETRVHVQGQRIDCRIFQAN